MYKYNELGDNIEYQIREEAKAEATKEIQARFDRAVQSAIRDTFHDLRSFYEKKGLGGEEKASTDAMRRYRYLFDRLRQEFGEHTIHRREITEEDGA